MNDFNLINPNDIYMNNYQFAFETLTYLFIAIAITMIYVGANMVIDSYVARTCKHTDILSVKKKDESGNIYYQNICRICKKESTHYPIKNKAQKNTSKKRVSKRRK